MVDALAKLNGKGRAVVAIDPDTITDDELRSMHALGVRGVRLNLKTTNVKFDRAEFMKILRTYADKIRPYGWALQMYVAMDQIPLIAEGLPTLGVPIVIDHLGSPVNTSPPLTQEGYAELMALLAEKKVYVKLSGLYRFPQTPDIENYIREILRIAPTQVVWASDWPHSGSVENNPGGDRTKVQEYRKVDIPGFVINCKTWCGGDEELIKKIFVDNPRKLWQYDGED
jgi:predicted TIM-barrel fold metal-dependent hydrolase